MSECLNFFNRGGMGTMMFMGIFWILLLVVVVFLIGKLFFNQPNQSSNSEPPFGNSSERICERKYF